MVSIFDYDAGNLKSVVKAFHHIGVETKIASTGSDLVKADRLVVPGVGAFGAAVSRMKDRGVFGVLAEYFLKDRPFLGICLGMQLLAEGSEEAPGQSGYAILGGQCRRFMNGKVPHIGWNRVDDWRRRMLLFDGIDAGACFYFVHSYYMPVFETDCWDLATTDYHTRFVSAIQKGNLSAVQFHPEKSGEAGLNLLRNWMRR
jgi:glutamine amidotransferase/cyclase